MAMVTHSTKRNRVYQRAFDHEQAAAMRKQDMSFPEIADYFGVSVAAVRRVLVPGERERMDANTRRWFHENKRKPCKGGCGKLVWAHTGRTGFCSQCLAKQEVAADVRDGRLRCTKCREWKDDDDFGRDGSRRTRRGRRAWCRECETASRRDNRRANRERERANDNARKRAKGARVATYTVMRKGEDGCWEERETVEAVSRLHAIEKVADAPGGWVAVNAKHLEELTVEPVTGFRVVKNGAAPVREAA